jgi:hypothetical protein
MPVLFDFRSYSFYQAAPEYLPQGRGDRKQRGGDERGGGSHPSSKLV